MIGGTTFLMNLLTDFYSVNTPGRRQSKTFLPINERGSKMARNSVFDCHSKFYFSQSEDAMVLQTCHEKSVLDS